MKRERISKKRTILKRIEDNRNRYTYIEKSGVKKSGLLLDVELVITNDMIRKVDRNAIRRGGVKTAVLKAQSKWMPILEEKKKVIIVTSAYKAQDFIEECLDSIENQTYFIDNDNYQILVGVDGCQETLDKLLEIRYKYRNLRIFMMDKNMGTYVTTNTLISMIRTTHIFRFDSDDIMMPEVINEVMHYVEDYNVVRYKYIKLAGDIKIPANLHAHGAIYLNRSVFTKLGGYQPWMCGADTELLKRGALLISQKLINYHLFYRRTHENSLTRSPEYGMKSEKRKSYHALIGKHVKVKIKRVVNTFK